MFDWTDLKFFLHVQRSGNLSAAARQLGVNQTTVGRRLAALEVMLGARLFDRTPGGLRLTSTGRDVVRFAENMESQALALERRVGNSDRAAEGTVHVTSPEAMGSRFVAPRLAPFFTKYPRIHVDLGTSARIFDLARREADVAFRTGDVSEADVVSKKVGIVAFTLYASAAYLEARGTPRGAGDLDGHRVIGYDEGIEAALVDRWRGPHPAALRSNSTALVYESVVAGVGIGVLPCWLGDATAQLRRILPASAPLQSRDLWVIVHRDLRKVVRVRAVTDFLVAMATQERDLLGGKRLRT